MSEAPDAYRRLQQHLDRMPVGFPATASGVELRILRRLFTPEEAEVALLLSAVPETLDRIHARDRGSGRTRQALEQTLDALAEKGAILGGAMVARPGGRKRYSKAMLVIGMYELQVDRLTKELEQDVTEYVREAFGRALLTRKTTQMRTVPLSVSFVAERRVGCYDDVRSLLREGSGPWAVMNCVCRQGKDLVGEPCRQTDVRRTCLALRGVARSVVARGSGQEVSRLEALALLERAEREGMVLQPENTRDPHFVCFCCGCCCGLLRAAKQFPRPAEYLHSNYQARFVAAECHGCDACLARCPMEALRTAGDGIAIDLDRCIGCGACAGVCPSGALRLVAKAVAQAPPRTRDALYLRILRERYGALETARLVGRTLLGRRI